MGFVATENDLNHLNFNFDLVDYARTNNFVILTPPTPPPMPPLLWHISLAFDVSPPIPPPMPTSLLWHISLALEENQDVQNEENVFATLDHIVNDNFNEENINNLQIVESLEPFMNVNFDQVDYSDAVAIIEDQMESECCSPEPIEIEEPCYFDLLPMEVRIFARV